MNSIYYGAGKLHEQSQDYSNILLYNGIEYGVLATENYSKNDKYVSVRAANYTSGVLRVRLKASDNTSEKRKVLRVVPVIILVLNFSNHRWKKNKSLHKLMKNEKRDYEKRVKKKCVTLEQTFMSDEDYNELISNVPEYEPKIIDVAFLSKEVRERFTSDFKIVADFFAEKREGSYNPYNHNEVIKHPLDMLMFFKEYASDNEYEAIKESIIRRIEEGEAIKMCTDLTAWWEDTMKFTEFRYQTSLPMYAAIHTVPTWPSLG